jgi:hypothetical protein
MSKYLLFILFGALACNTKDSKLAKRYNGWWGETWWEFKFSEDGSYSRHSAGHYGNTDVTGRYEVKDSVVHLLNGYQNTHGTVNEYYVLSKDGHLVDTKLLYDYAPSTNDSATYNSVQRIEYNSWIPPK